MVRRISPIVTSRKRTREGRGFSRNELLQVGLSFGEAIRLGIPIDKRRNTVYEENVETLNNWVKETKG
jgi:large subunit ribosomal protein L13e